MTLDARLLEWGEDWASSKTRRAMEPGWSCESTDDHIVVCWSAGLSGARDERWQLAPLQFWLWAHAVDSERTDSQRCPDCEGGRRWRCVWTNYVDDMELAQSESAARAESLGVPHRVRRGTDEAGRGIIDVLKGDPCPTCTGPAVECEACHGIGEAPPLGHSCQACAARGYIPGKPLGYISRPLARVVCEAMPTTLVASGYATEHDAREVAERVIRLAQGPRRNWTPVVWRVRRDVEHDPRGFDEDHGWGVFAGGSAASLEAHADALQAEGDPLGQALALWLHGVPCEACKGKGEHERGTEWIHAHNERDALIDAADLAVLAVNAGIRFEPVWNGEHDVNLIRHVSCAVCHGDGTALGAYVAAQLEDREPPEDPAWRRDQAERLTLAKGVTL